MTSVGFSSIFLLLLLLESLVWLQNKNIYILFCFVNLDVMRRWIVRWMNFERIFTDLLSEIFCPIPFLVKWTLFILCFIESSDHTAVLLTERACACHRGQSHTPCPFITATHYWFIWRQQSKTPEREREKREKGDRRERRERREGEVMWKHWYFWPTFQLNK